MARSARTPGVEADPRARLLRQSGERDGAELAANTVGKIARSDSGMPVLAYGPHLK